MESTLKKTSLTGLAHILLLEGLLKEHEAYHAIEQAKREKVSIAQYLVDAKILSASEIAMVASKDFGVPFLDLDAYEKDLVPINLVSEKLIRKHNAIPLFTRGSHLYIALADPSQQIILDEIKFHTGLTAYAILVECSKLGKFIDEAISAKDNDVLDEFLDDADLDNLEVSVEDD